MAIESTVSLLELLRWPGRVVRSSDFHVSVERSARLAELTLAVGAAAYVCGTGGAGYLRPDPFRERGVEIVRFSVPTEGNSVVWAAATRLSSLAALAEAGASAVHQAFADDVDLGRRMAPPSGPARLM
ncbi:hypothetical protein GCM10010530_54570 [Kribbella aluminosa]